MRLRRTLLLLLFLLTGGPWAHAQYWERELPDGSRVQVDPNTNRATVQTPSGTTTPLWDGVHKLEDGSSITVHAGVMVPNRSLQEFKEELARAHRPFANEGTDICLRLARKVCGLHGECAAHPACSPARQLQKMAKEDLEHPPDAAYSTTLPARVQCEEALKDEDFFVPCDRMQRGPQPTACEQLLDKVCGGHEQCKSSDACPPARQLLEMEYQERHSAVNADAPTFTSGQCQRALADEKFFAPCKR